VNRAEQLDQLDKTIKNAELSLKSIQNNIDQLLKEINILNPQKIELEHNLQFHKRVGVIPIAHEYGKSKRALTQITNRLNLITTDHTNCVQAFNHVQEIIQKFKKEYRELLFSKEDNVIRALFGAKRGKK